MPLLIRSYGRVGYSGLKIFYDNVLELRIAAIEVLLEMKE